MADKNHGLAVEATQGSNEAKQYTEQSTTGARSTAGYMVRMFGYGMVLVYAALFVTIIFLSYGLIL